MSRHCNDSLQAPGESTGLGQGLALTRSNPPVSKTCAVSKKFVPFRTTRGGLFTQMAVLARTPVLQLFRMFTGTRLSVSLLSKFSPLVWAKIASLPGARVNPVAPRKDPKG